MSDTLFWAAVDKYNEYFKRMFDAHEERISELEKVLPVAPTADDVLAAYVAGLKAGRKGAK